MRTASALLTAASLFFLSGPAIAEGAVGKAIGAYYDRNTTKLILETREALVAGRQVYVGPKRIAVTVSSFLSKSESLYYYGASAPGKHKIDSGDEIELDAPRQDGGSRLLPATSPLAFEIKEHYTFEQKRQGEVTAIQGDRAMIDRGSLHEVRERDIYRVYDSSGHYKGLLELRAIGDLQSSGKLYNALEDYHRNALKTAPGDRVIFAGQRKLFGLGFEGGIKAQKSELGSGREENYGGGLLWNITLPDGWGAEVLFGTYVLAGKSRQATLNSQVVQTLDRKAFFIAPIWAKKNFFYPSVISPFVAAGFSLFVGSNHWTYTNATNGVTIDEDAKSSKIVPVLGAGIELFPGRFFRPRFDVRYFAGPRIDAGANSYRTEAVFYSLGFVTTW